MKSKLDKIKAIYENNDNDMYITLYPHKAIGKGKLILNKSNVSIGLGTELDLTGNIKIGDFSEISNSVTIFTHKHMWNHSRDIRSKIHKILPVDLFIGRDVFIGDGAIIICVNTIGDGAIIGAGSVVTKNIPPYEVWAGNPAKKINERRGN